jgi:membrane protein
VKSPEATSSAAVEGWRRLRLRYRWFDHIVRAVDRYIEHSGYQYVASISYFSLLSLVPMLMVSFSTAGFVLAGHPELLDRLRDGITDAVPGSLGKNVGELLDNLIQQRTKVGLLGLLVGLYSGWNWMNALRDSLTAMWDQKRVDQPLWRTIFKDLLALVSLAAALLVSFTFTAIGGALGSYLLRLAHVDDESWTHTAVSLGSVPLALLADWLVFLWVLAKLPREAVGTRSAVRGAVAAAVGFELLKQAGSVYIGLIGNSPTGAAFGSVIGLLVFISLVSRLLVFITAWTSTARDTPGRAVAPPEPAVIRVAPPRHSGALLPAAVGVAVGVLSAGLFTRRRGR